MPNAWWREDTGSVALGYEHRPIKAIITEAEDFFAGLDVCDDLYFLFSAYIS
jgi:hypothetical protein